MRGLKEVGAGLSQGCLYMDPRAMPQGRPFPLCYGPSNTRWSLFTDVTTPPGQCDSPVQGDHVRHDHGCTMAFVITTVL